MKLFIGGDIYPQDRLQNALKNPQFTDTIKSITSKVDYAIVNLECPLTESNSKIPKTGPHLKAHPHRVNDLIQLGFNTVTLANNHIYDYNERGLFDTLETLQNHQIHNVGAGKKPSQNATIYLTQNNLTIALINVCEQEWSTPDSYKTIAAADSNDINTYYLIQQAKKEAQKVILIHHGGHENYPLPSPNLKKKLRFFADAGADAIINHHTHCVSGFELHNQTPIFYSLGNFLFDNQQPKNHPWNMGMGVFIECNAHELKIEPIYFKQFDGSTDFEIISVDTIKTHINDLNSIIQNDQLLTDQFQKFVAKEKTLYNIYLQPFNNRFLLALINRGLWFNPWSKVKRKYLKNLISCESHREVVLNILTDEISHSQK